MDGAATDGVSMDGASMDGALMDETSMDVVSTPRELNSAVCVAAAHLGMGLLLRRSMHAASQKASYMATRVATHTLSRTAAHLFCGAAWARRAPQKASPRRSLNSVQQKVLL